MSRTMTFTEYNRFIIHKKEEIEEFDRRIAYREIQLIGRKAPIVNLMMNSFGGDKLTEDENATLSGDEILRNLKDIRAEANKLLDYVRCYGKLPIYIDEIKDAMEVDTIGANNRAEWNKKYIENVLSSNQNSQNASADIPTCCCCEKKEDPKNEEEPRT